MISFKNIHKYSNFEELTNGLKRLNTNRVKIDSVKITVKKEPIKII